MEIKILFDFLKGQNFTLHLIQTEKGKKGSLCMCFFGGRVDFS